MEAPKSSSDTLFSKGRPNVSMQGVTEQERMDMLRAISAELRARIYETVRTAGSGHLGGTSSSVELMTALYFGGLLKYDPTDPRNQNRDRVLVRGHLGPLRYNLFSLLGWVDEPELKTYRQLGSRLQGHESMELVPGVDITPSGSLGMLLSYGTGAAYAAKKMKQGFRTYVFLGDGEEEEGNVSEAARHAGKLGLDNLICILDKNTKQLSRSTADVDRADIKKLWESYGWDVREIANGNSISEVMQAYSALRHINRPTLVIAHTTKGLGLIGAEDNCCGYHTISSCPAEALTESIEIHRKLVSSQGLDIKSAASKLAATASIAGRSEGKGNGVLPQFTLQVSGEKDNIPAALKDCTALLTKQLAENNIRFYVMTADMVRSDTIYSYGFDETVNYIDVGLREQHMFAMAHGISQTDKTSRILILPGEQFMYRAADQLNAMAQSSSSAVIVVTKAGVADNHNGSTHQSVGQPGMLLTMPGVKMLEPADATDLYTCMKNAFQEYEGPTYIRLTDVEVKPLSAERGNGDWYVASKPSAPTDIVLVASGFMVSKAVDAAQKLSEKQGISCKVLSVVNPASLDRKFIEELEDGKPVLTLYNGNPDVLRQVVAGKVMEFDSKRPSRIAGHGFKIGTSGKLNDLLRHFEFDPDGIAHIAARLVGIAAKDGN